MVDMEGIDLLAVQGETIPGLYNKLVESIALCRYQCVYNWSFNSILIPPTYVEMEEREDGVWINEGVMVDEEDVIHIASIEPEPPPPILPVIESLSVAENGTYLVPEGVDGFNPVVVNVPTSSSDCYYRVAVIDPNENILYEEYFASGSSVEVNKPFFYNNTVYYLDLDISSIENSVNILVTSLPVLQNDINIVQVLNNTDMYLDGFDLIIKFITSNNTSGIIFSATRDVVVKYINFSYRQCGRCTTTATLPSVQDRGSGRTYYTSPANNVETTISYVQDNNFFVSGTASNVTDPTIIIKNFIVE